MPVDADSFATALRQHATGVCLLTVQDDIDDVGTTVSSVMSVSLEPPLIAVGLSADGYPAEVLSVEPAGSPLVRLRGRYVDETGRAAGRG
jgi:flavin reductase (DIM6/NTAB) family NADH-FMN oxidoreductase RutF